LLDRTVFHVADVIPDFPNANLLDVALQCLEGAMCYQNTLYDFLMDDEKLQEAAALQLIQLTLTFVGICTALWNSEISESVSAELDGKVAIGTFGFCLLKSSVDVLQQCSLPNPGLRIAASLAKYRSHHRSIDTSQLRLACSPSHIPSNRGSFSCASV
jgi:hypothetical protein